MAGDREQTGSTAGCLRVFQTDYAVRPPALELPPKTTPVVGCGGWVWGKRVKGAAECRWLVMTSPPGAGEGIGRDSDMLHCLMVPP